MVLILLHHPILTTSEKNSSLGEGLLFIGGFKVGSVPGMLNKEVLAYFI